MTLARFAVRVAAACWGAWQIAALYTETRPRKKKR